MSEDGSGGGIGGKRKAYKGKTYTKICVITKSPKKTTIIHKQGKYHVPSNTGGINMKTNQALAIHMIQIHMKNI